MLFLLEESGNSQTLLPRDHLLLSSPTYTAPRDRSMVGPRIRAGVQGVSNKGGWDTALKSTAHLGQGKHSKSFLGKQILNCTWGMTNPPTVSFKEVGWHFRDSNSNSDSDSATLNFEVAQGGKPTVSVRIWALTPFLRVGLAAVNCRQPARQSAVAQPPVTSHLRPTPHQLVLKNVGKTINLTMSPKCPTLSGKLGAFGVR